MSGPSYLTNNHWLVALPLEAGTVHASLAPLQNAVAERGGAAVAEVTEFAAPSLKVGTLDSLMALGDEMARADAYCEGVVRKTERQIAEATSASRAGGGAAAAGAGTGSSSVAGAAAAVPFRVASTPVADYVKRWGWDR